MTIEDYLAEFDDPPSIEQLRDWYQRVEAGRLRSRYFTREQGLAWLAGEIRKREQESTRDARQS